MSTWMAWTVGGGGALTPTDLTGYVVTKDDANSVSLAAGPGSEPYGVIVGVAEDGNSVEVCVAGVCRARVGAAGIDPTAPTNDVQVEADFAGQIQPYAAGAATWKLGRIVAASAALAQDDMTEILIEIDEDSATP